MATVELSNIQRRIIVAITLSASFLSVLMLFLLITAFPKIMIEFEINSTEVQWLTTSFMVKEQRQRCLMKGSFVRKTHCAVIKNYHY